MEVDNIEFRVYVHMAGTHGHGRHNGHGHMIT